ncbi:hypothetical protein D3C72_1926710 [compost metagenome]
MQQKQAPVVGVERHLVVAAGQSGERLRRRCAGPGEQLLQCTLRSPGRLQQRAAIFGEYLETQLGLIDMPGSPPAALHVDRFVQGGL